MDRDSIAFGVAGNSGQGPEVIGLAFVGALVAGAILAIAFVPSGDTLQDAENDAGHGCALFAVLCILAVIGLVFVL